MPELRLSKRFLKEKKFSILRKDSQITSTQVNNYLFKSNISMIAELVIVVCSDLQRIANCSQIQARILYPQPTKIG